VEKQPYNQHKSNRDKETSAKIRSYRLGQQTQVAGLQQESKVCIQTCALLYIAAFPCIPNCHGIMSHLITGDYVIKFERNSFRVQLSARGIATCFASAQPKAQVSGGVDCLRLCLGAAEVKVKKSNSNHSGNFSGSCK